MGLKPRSAYSVWVFRRQPPPGVIGWSIHSILDESLPWWLVVFPGVPITLTVRAVNILGDGIRDTLAPGYVALGNKDTVMQFGVHIIGAGPMADPDKLVTAAQKAEALGYHSLWLSDHLGYPMTVESTYPYSDSGSPPLSPTTKRLENLIALTWIAAHTSRIKFGPSVLVVPYREPLLLAKQVATLDVLSKGRFIFGVGVGWLDQEFRFVGQKLEERGPRTQECLDVMKACWTRDAVTYHGQFFDIDEFCVQPHPVQKPHPPIWFGGNTRAALRRTAQMGDGWHAAFLSPDEMREKINMLGEYCEQAGRSIKDLNISLQPIGRVDINTETVEQFRELGVDMLIMPRVYQTDLPQLLDHLDQFNEEVKKPAEASAR